MNIKVLITRKENADYFNIKVNEAISIDLEDYISGVVASEIGNAPLNACKAQAIASRTTAYNYYLKNKAISDSSSTAQAFRTSRMRSASYPNASTAADETKGMVLFYGNNPCSPCSFSHSNGGRTVSSKERWGGDRPWLISKYDPWDSAETNGIKKGHGVGMSQAGAKYAANKGISYLDILSFYYPGTEIKQINIAKAIEGDNDMATYNNVKASYLIDKFKQMKEENWKYVADAAEKGKVDCSGAFTYWYRQAGSFMYHGSNTMYRQYSTEKGKIGQIPLVPGMAVYRWHNDGKEPARYKGDGLGNFSHVGLYIGNGKCIEAKGTKSGIVESNISTWTYASKLKYTIYDLVEGQQNMNVEKQMQNNTETAVYGVVKTENGRLNLRTKPSTSAPVALRVERGTRLRILETLDGWYKVKYGNNVFYAMSEFITTDAEALKPNKYTYIITLDDSNREEIIEYLISKKINLELQK